MKNTLRYIIGLSLLAIISACNSKVNDPNFKDDLGPIENLPEIHIQLLDSTNIMLSGKLPEDKVTLLYYFDPDCPHCKLETRMLLNNKIATKDAHIAFLSNTDLVQIQKYDSLFSISAHKNTIIGKDIEHSFTKYINAGSFPLLVLYNKKHKLQQIFHGEVSDDVLTKFLSETL